METTIATGDLVEFGKDTLFVTGVALSAEGALLTGHRLADIPVTVSADDVSHQPVTIKARLKTIADQVLEEEAHWRTKTALLRFLGRSMTEAYAPEDWVECPGGGYGQIKSVKAVEDSPGDSLAVVAMYDPTTAEATGEEEEHAFRRLVSADDPVEVAARTFTTGGGSGSVGAAVPPDEEDEPERNTAGKAQKKEGMNGTMMRLKLLAARVLSGQRIDPGDLERIIATLNLEARNAPLASRMTLGKVRGRLQTLVPILRKYRHTQWDADLQQGAAQRIQQAIGMIDQVRSSTNPLWAAVTGRSASAAGGFGNGAGGDGEEARRKFHPGEIAFLPALNQLVQIKSGDPITGIFEVDILDAAKVVTGQALVLRSELQSRRNDAVKQEQPEYGVFTVSRAGRPMGRVKSVGRSAAALRSAAAELSDNTGLPHIPLPLSDGLLPLRDASAAEVEIALELSGSERQARRRKSYDPAQAGEVLRRIRRTVGGGQFTDLEFDLLQDAVGDIPATHPSREALDAALYQWGESEVVPDSLPGAIDMAIAVLARKAARPQRPLPAAPIKSWKKSIRDIGIEINTLRQMIGTGESVDPKVLPTLRARVEQIAGTVGNDRGREVLKHMQTLIDQAFQKLQRQGFAPRQGDQLNELYNTLAQAAFMGELAHGRMSVRSAARRFALPYQDAIRLYHQFGGTTGVTGAGDSAGAIGAAADALDRQQ